MLKLHHFLYNVWKSDIKRVHENTGTMYINTDQLEGLSLRFINWRVFMVKQFITGYCKYLNWKSTSTGIIDMFDVKTGRISVIYVVHIDLRHSLLDPKCVINRLCLVSTKNNLKITVATIICSDNVNYRTTFIFSTKFLVRRMEPDIMRCTPGARFLHEDGCNSCTCTPSGETALCTLLSCDNFHQDSKFL